MTSFEDLDLVTFVRVDLQDIELTCHVLRSMLIHLC